MAERAATVEKTPAVTVLAPVITDPVRDAGLLLGYVDSLKQNSLLDIAAAESKRLDPYFQAMSRYLLHVFHHDEAKLNLTAGEKKMLPGLLSPGSLSGIFNDMAAFSRNTLLSDVAVLTTDVMEKGEAAQLFKNQKQFDVGFSYGGRKLQFGFLQVHRADHKNAEKSSTTFPTFMLDSAVTDKIPEEFLKPLFSDLQKIMTIVNHDVLHHFTMPAINEDIAVRHDREKMAMTPIRGWKPMIPHLSPQQTLYEEWAHLSQERILLSGENSPALKDLKEGVDNYFATLGRAVSALAQNGTDQKDISETADYMSTAMLHALTRLLPLDHPLMLDAIQKAESTDPAPGRLAGKCLASLMGGVDLGMDAAQSARMISNIAIAKPGLSEIVSAYRDQGCDMLPADASQTTYAKIKQLQLAALSTIDTRAHAPASDSHMAQLQDRQDKIITHMVLAASRTVR